MDLIALPALQDNYIWLLINPQHQCLIVDPSTAAPVLPYLAAHGLTPTAILLTHHHHDHVGGVAEIVRTYPELPVYGPAETQGLGCTQVVNDHDTLSLLGLPISVMALPGHTLGHVGYYCAPYLFCGDTLFSAGCGRLFEGTPQQMFDSLQRIMSLPDDTLVCCAHEYTESNLRFARHVLPQNQTIETYQQHVALLRSKQQPTLPSTLRIEREINPFLCCYNNDLQRNVGFSTQPNEIWQVFACLRDMKDHF